MKNIIKYFLSLLFILIVFMANAQVKVLHGYVTSFENIPVEGAEVKVKSTDQIVITDTLGYFFVGVNSTDKLTIRANGFYKQNVKIGEKTRIAAINLKLKPGQENRFIATGYGHVNATDKVSAVDNIQDDDFNFSVYNNIYELIKGRIPGVQIENGEVIIRGLSSVNMSNAALIVVDGITANQQVLNSISPRDVKNISVIKDASSSIYGFQGVNGVIIIETKKGGENSPL